MTSPNNIFTDVLYSTRTEISKDFPNDQWKYHHDHTLQDITKAASFSYPNANRLL